MAAPYYVYGSNLLNREKYTSVVNTAYGRRRYFSSIDTDVYFGNVPVDEMVAFDFIIDEKKIPIYGYNNFTPKRIITGQKTIQGSFAINFTQTFSLKNIIDGLGDSIYANDYEEAQFYCGDDNQALFGKGFDITLSYGDHNGEGSYNSCSQTLVGCYITSYRQAFDTSGEPILDMYTFIAKDLLLNVDLAYELPKEDETQYYAGPEPPTGTGGINSSDPYRVANNMVQKEYEEMLDYYYKNTTSFCVVVNPTFTVFNDIPTLTMFISECPNDDIVNAKSIKICINDNSALGKSYNFTLEKCSDYIWQYKMQGQYIQLGNKISKLYKNNDIDSLSCEIEIVCTTDKLEGEQTLLHDTIITFEEY